MHSIAFQKTRVKMPKNQEVRLFQKVVKMATFAKALVKWLSSLKKGLGIERETGGFSKVTKMANVFEIILLRGYKGLYPKSTHFL